MTDFAILDEMIQECARVSVGENEYGKRELVLIEPQDRRSSVTLAGIPDRVMIIKADTFASPDTIFKGRRGECKRADYVIIAEKPNGKFIVCIEVKAGNAPENEIIRQLAGAECFIRYCQSIGKAFWNERAFLDGYSYRFVSIRHTSMHKGKTRIEQKAASHDRPEHMLKISAPNRLEFNRLIGGQA